MKKLSKKEEKEKETLRLALIRPKFLEEKIEEDEIKYQTIVEYCRINNQTFVDGEFPPKLSSWLPIKQVIRKKVEAWWKLTDISYNWFRPTTQLYLYGTVRRDYDGTEYYVARKPLGQWSVYNNPTSMGAVSQGRIGNCGLIAALALIARHPEILKEIFPRNEISEYGVYQVRLCLYGEWKTIIVDDWFPGECMTFLGCDNFREELWPSLIEKALAKTHKSYYGLTAYIPEVALAVLTDSPTVTYTLSKWNDKDEFWRMLKSYASQFLITVATLKFVKKSVVQLRPCHMYSLVEVFEEGPIRLIRARNTYRNSSFLWDGDWSEGWSGWPEELRKRLITDKEEISASFWIEYKDFLKFSDYIAVCKYRPSWSRIRWKMVMGQNGRQNQAMLKISVHKTTTVVISAFEPGKDRVMSFWLSIHYAEEDGKLGEPVTELQLPYMSSEDVQLSPGTYFVMITSLVDALIETNGVLYSSLPICLKLVNIYDEHVLEAFQQQVMKYGDIVPVTRENLRIKQILKYGEYMFMMVENYSRDHYLHFYVNVGDPKSYYHVYGSKLLTRHVKSIPPMSRRIVVVFLNPKRNHFKPTFEYHFSSKETPELKNVWYDRGTYRCFYKCTPILEEELED